MAPPKKNPFLLFAETKKAELESEGHVFPGGIKDVIEIAGKFWEKMSAEERLPYQERAKQLKEKREREIASQPWGDATNKPVPGPNDVTVYGRPE